MSDAASSRLPAVVVMAKRPDPASVKTRLSGALSPDGRARLYEAMLRDKLDQVRALPGSAPVLAFTPDDARAEMGALAGAGVHLIAQRGADLGERLANVVQDLFAAGRPGVVVVDSDTPNLPTAHLAEAVAAVGAYDLVLGPAWDGGYYLIGLSAPRPSLFAGVSWSTAHVLEQTLATAESLALSVRLLPSWYDVDEPADLDRLARQLASAPREAPGFPARTAAALAGHAPAAGEAPRNERWRTLSTRAVYENRWIRVDESVVRTARGHVTLYGVVSCARCVGVVPLREDGHVLLVRQFRYVARRSTWEIPTGAAHPGESLEQAASRELSEEAGLSAGRLTHLATFHTSKSVVDEVAHVYLGDRLGGAVARPDPTEEIETAWFSFDEAVAMIARGEIVDSMTVIGLLTMAGGQGAGER